eukprot:6392832-Ditylum_brightwellii.AAC.1
MGGAKITTSVAAGQNNSYNSIIIKIKGGWQSLNTEDTVLDTFNAVTFDIPTQQSSVGVLSVTKKGKAKHGCAKITTSIAA